MNEMARLPIDSCTFHYFDYVHFQFIFLDRYIEHGQLQLPRVSAVHLNQILAPR